MAGLVFNRAENARPVRSAFDLSYEKKFTCDMGELIPVMCDEMVPGDTFIVGAEAVVRFQPLVAPILHEINLFIHYFFVPYRILWSSWEDFISGGKLGTDASTLPTWNCADTSVGSLWDYLGFPTGITLPANNRPMDFPREAYNLIYNEFYRDETQVTELVITTAEDIQLRAYEKDYFTSALPWQQRGTAPALPIDGTLNVDSSATFTGTAGDSYAIILNAAAGKAYAGTSADHNAQAIIAFNKTTVDLSGGTTFDVADLRLAFQLQKWMERNARAGYRYQEFIKSHFGVDLEDYRASRPEYVGGMKSPVIVSEVVQTSGGADDADATPQGTMVGHALSADRQHIGKYTAKEFGLMMGILSVMPKPAYSCQGVPRQWTKSTRYDFYFPEFAMLSEQPVLRMELYATAVENNNETVFGYQGKYDEMRVKHDMVCGDMRDTFDTWHLARQFAAPPELNQTFIECDGSAAVNKRIFAVTNEDGLVVNVRNIIKAIRPIPEIATPGLIDHI